MSGIRSGDIRKTASRLGRRAKPSVSACRIDRDVPTVTRIDGSEEGERKKKGKETRKGRSMEWKSSVEFVNPIGRRSFVADFGMKFPAPRNPGNPLTVVGPAVIRSAIIRRSVDDVSRFTRSRGTRPTSTRRDSFEIESSVGESTSSRADKRESDQPSSRRRFAVTITRQRSKP